MTPAHIASLREKVGLWGRLIVAVWTDVRLAGGVAQALAQRNQKPGTKPMSVFDALGSLTKSDIIGYIDKAETLQGPLTEIRSVVNHHFRDIREDATVGVWKAMQHSQNAVIKAAADAIAPTGGVIQTTPDVANNAALVDVKNVVSKP